MTLDDFIEKLAQTPGPWFLNDDSIRCHGLCPLEVVGGSTRSDTWSLAYKSLGLRSATADLIMDAADNHELDCEDPGLRARLLAATVDRKAS